MKKLTILAGLVMVLTLALPGSANAAALSEVKKLTASDAQANDIFGRRVAISGDTAIAGAHAEDAGGTDAGAAYIYERNQGGPGNWGEVKKLVASNAQATAAFGIAVAVSGDTAIVGAIGENTGGPVAGAAYIFERNQGGPNNWGEVTKLTASDAQTGDNFGASVAISGDTIIVGAHREDAGGTDAGAAYIFERNQGGPDNWGEVKKLTASDALASDLFGVAVAIDGDTAIVSACERCGTGTSTTTGAAYVFDRDNGGLGNWGEVKILTASDAQVGDEFGIGVAISGDTAIVGAWLEDPGGISAAGAAYVFQRNQGGPNNWGEVKKLTASDGQAQHGFGVGVAISGDSAIVGAFGADAGGVNGGAAYVFERDQGGPNNWGEMKKLTASDAQASDQFGVGVAISGASAIMGAPLEGAGGAFAGAAYIFQAPSDEQININVVDRLSGAKLAGTCWRISYVLTGPIYPIPLKTPHDVVGDDVAGVKPDCGEPSNVKLFDKDPSAGSLRITITSDQRVQYGDIWHAQMSFSPIGGLDPNNYECDLSLGKCRIGPVAVGGLVVELDGGPLAAAQSSGSNARRLAGTVAGITALAVALALGGAAWYARRRWAR